MAAGEYAKIQRHRQRFVNRAAGATPVTGVLSALGSLVATMLFVAAGLVVAQTVRGRFFREWRGTLSATVLALVWLCWALVIAQGLGAVGLLRTVPLVVAALVTALGAVGLDRRLPPTVHPPAGTAAPARAEPGAPPPAGADWADVALTVGVVVLVLLVAALWTARTVIALRRGINDPDSLGYHLPLMATFARSGFADQHRLLIPLYPVQFYPANDELLSAVALLLTRSVAFAALKNLLFGALLLVAAHALGSAYRAGRLAVAATAIVLGLPVIAFSQPGAATNDCLLLVGVLGALAVLAHAGDRPAPYVLALAGAGIALGVKFSAIVPAAAVAGLAIILLVARVRRHRLRGVGAGLLASAALGGSWYLRNAISYRNPVPPDRIAVGPLHLRAIISYEGLNAFSVAHYLVEGRFIGTFGHSLVRALGPVGAVLAVVGVVASVASLATPDGFRRGLGGLALACLAGYLITPAGAAGTRIQLPYAMVINVHYAAAGLVAAAIAAALAVAPYRAAWLVPAAGVVAVLTGVRSGQGIAIWAPEIGGTGFVLLVVATAVGAAAAVAWCRPDLRRRAPPAVVAAALVAVVGMVAIAGHFRSRRATDPVASWAARVPATKVAAWVANIADLYGPGTRNQVTVVARLDHGAAAPVDDCQGWKRAVVAGHFPYTAVIPGSAWTRWLRADPAFVPVAHDVSATVFKVVGEPDVTCAGQSNQGADFWVVPPGGA